MTVLLVQWLVAGCLIAATATLVVRLVPTAAAAERHLIWWGALIAVLMLPFVPWLVGPTLVPASPAPVPNPADAQAPLFTIAEPPMWLMSIAVALWALVTAISIVRLVLGVRAARRLVRGSVPLDESFADPSWPGTDAGAGVLPRRRVTVVVSGEIRGACAVGFTRPHVLVSADLLATLDRQALHAIVLHEHAHLERYDDWTRLAQRVVLAVAGLHPAVRWISGQLDIECEMACDQRVVKRTREPHGYARALAAVAEVVQRPGGRVPRVAPGASVTGRGLHVRVSRVLAAVSVPPLVRRVSSASAAACVGVATLVAAVLPPVVAVGVLSQPLAALVARPLGAGLAWPLPVTTRPALPTEQSEQAAPGARPARRDMDIVDTPAEIAQVADSAERVKSAEIAPSPHVADGPQEPPAPLPSRPLPPQTDFSIALAEPLSAAGEPTGIGATASRGAAATASAAARAGQSIGRFFSSRGRAVSDRFQ